MAKSDFILTKEYLHDIFEYCDGDLYWKKTGRGRKLNCKAGNIRPDGRTDIYLIDRLVRSHRIIYMMFHGTMPEEIDHIDGNPSNNKIENLRAVTHTENMHNRKLPKTNKSGYKNIHWYSAYQKWQVQIRANKKRYHIGYFSNIEDAKTAAFNARNKYHGEFATHV